MIASMKQKVKKKTSDDLVVDSWEIYSLSTSRPPCSGVLTRKRRPSSYILIYSSQHRWARAQEEGGLTSPCADIWRLVKYSFEPGSN